MPVAHVLAVISAIIRKRVYIGGDNMIRVVNLVSVDIAMRVSFICHVPQAFCAYEEH